MLTSGEGLARPDLVFTYYPSWVDFYWFVSRTISTVNAQHRATPVPPPAAAVGALRSRVVAVLRERLGDNARTMRSIGLSLQQQAWWLCATRPYLFTMCETLNFPFLAPPPSHRRPGSMLETAMRGVGTARLLNSSATDKETPIGLPDRGACFG